MPPSMLLETAPVTMRTEFEKEHCSELDSTAKVEQDVTPWKYSYGEVAEGFHLGKDTLIVPPLGIACVGLNLTVSVVEAPTIKLVGVRDED